MEDESIIAIDTARRISERGYRVHTVSNGEKAISFVNEKAAVDLVLMDIDLGKGIDGTEAAERILEKHDIPIVFLSSHSEQKMVEKVRNITRYGYVLKSAGDFVLFSSIEMAFELFEAHTRARKNEEMLRQMSENIEEVFWLRNTDSAHFHYISSGCERIWGKSRESLYRDPESFTESVLEEDKAGLIDTYRRHLEGGELNTEYRILHPEKGVRWIWARSFPVLDDAGRLIRIAGAATDITDQKTIEESDTFHSMVLDQIQDRVTVTDLEGRITYVNKAECQSFNLSKEELIGKHVSVYGDNPRHGATQAEILRTVLEKDYWRGQVVNYSSDGSEIFFDSRVQTVKDRQGKPVALCGISTDITGGMRIREELRRKKRDLETTINSVGDAVITTNRDGLITRINPVAQELMELGESDVLGKALNEVLTLINVDTREKLENPVEKVIRTGKIEGLANHTSLITAKGRERQISDSAAPIYSAENELLGVILVFRDVSEEYRMRRALEEHESRLSLAQKIAGLGNWEIDLARQTVTASKEAHRIYGIFDETVSLAEVKAAALPPYRASLDAALKNLIENNTPYDVEYQITRKSDGTTIDVHSAAVFNRETGRIVGTIQDVSRQKETERRIRGLLEQKENLLQEIHHRVKNNLHTIMSLLSLQADAVNSPEAAKALEDGRNRVAGIQKVYEKLHRSENFESLELDSFLSDIVDSLISSGVLEPETVRFEKNFAPLSVSSDAAISIGIIINELVSNSLKHAFPSVLSENEPKTRETGDRAVSRAKLSLSCLPHGEGEILISVSDNGPGFDGEAVLEDSKGGIGLQLVEAEVARMNGSIDIENDNGAHIRIHLPLLVFFDKNALQ